MQPLLSILICTLPQRRISFYPLFKNLSGQWMDYLTDHEEFEFHQLEILFDDRDTHVSVGIKRQTLLEGAAGKFVVYVDDDDQVSGDYVHSIFDVIAQNPDIDCIGIKGIISTDGKGYKNWEISKDFGSWYEKDNVYYRTPNHISPVRREIAIRAGGFNDMKFGEDADYSQRILPFLKNEVKIDKQIYHYQFQSKKDY